MLKNKKHAISNLKEDIENILNNKEEYFKEAQNIFDIYYIDKEQQTKPGSARGNQTNTNSTT